MQVGYECEQNDENQEAKNNPVDAFSSLCYCFKAFSYFKKVAFPVNLKSVIDRPVSDYLIFDKPVAYHYLIEFLTSPGFFKADIFFLQDIEASECPC